MRNDASKFRHNYWIRVCLFFGGVLILALVYVFQRINAAGWISGDFHPNVVFAVNRVIRLILNDLACLLIIFAVFRGRNYIKIAFLVFLVELLIILPAYLVVKLSLEGDSEISSPLLSQVHRLIVNPMLMILLMAGFFYQRYVRKATV